MKIHLQEGERTLHTEHFSLAPHALSLFLGAALLVGSSLFFFPFLQFGATGLVPILSVMLLGLFLLLRAAMRWQGSACVLTTQRVVRVEQRGLLERKVTFAPLQAIQDVAFRTSGMMGAVLHVGTVRVTFRGVIPAMHFASVMHPNVLHNLISELRALSLESGSVPTDFSRVHVSRTP